jgi:hypothetical protein
LFINLIFAIFALAAATLLSAQDTVATLSGKVQDFAGTPIIGTNAELTMEQPPHTLFSARADSDGRFRFTVPPGTYTLKLTKPGFKVLTVKSIQVANREQEQLPPLRLDIGGGCGDPALDYIELLPTEQGAGNLGSPLFSGLPKPARTRIARTEALSWSCHRTRHG